MVTVAPTLHGDVGDRYHTTSRQNLLHHRIAKGDLRKAFTSKVMEHRMSTSEATGRNNMTRRISLTSSINGNPIPSRIGQHIPAESTKGTYLEHPRQNRHINTNANVLKGSYQGLGERLRPHPFDTPHGDTLHLMHPPKAKTKMTRVV